MSTKKQQELLDRLEAIGRAVAGSGRGVALLGLGSVGTERERLDDYSDLDFFVIAKAGEKAYFLANLEWLEEVQPIVFYFQNTADGHKLLFEDGIFCETAVFEPDELANIPYSGARVVWQEAESQLVFPANNSLPQSPAQVHDLAWLLGEILTNLYVGLGRFKRGEKLTAARFVQGYAVDRILELAPLLAEQRRGLTDPFDADRRFEQRYPPIAKLLPQFVPGYEHTPAAAQAILRFVDESFKINQEMKEAVEALL